MALEDKAVLAQRLLTLTREMLDLARVEDWAALAACEAERQEVARDLFASPVPPEAAATVAESIREVLDIDQQLLGLVSAGREAAAKAMQDVRTGKKALDTYRRFSR